MPLKLFLLELLEVDKIFMLNLSVANYSKKKFKFLKVTFDELSSSPLPKEMKSRHCGLDLQSQELTYATPYQVRGDILEI